MVNNDSWIKTVRLRFAQTLSHPPLDLSIATISAVLLGIVVAMDIDPGWGLRASLVLFALALLPGYVLVAIVYPWNDQHDRDAFQPDYAERAALAFGTSVVLLPLLALVPGLLGVEYTPLTTLAVIEGLLAIGIPIAVYRRKGIQHSDQFRLPLSDGLAELSGWLRHTSRPRRLLRGAMIASVLLAMLSFGYVLAVPQDGERYSTMTLLSENESGDLVTAGYPTDLAVDESTALTLAVENNRQRETTYTVVVRLERVEGSDPEGITETEQLDRFRMTVADGDTWTQQNTITPTMAGEGLRLRYYLYVGEPPDSVGPETAQDYLHIWVDVAPP
jgi:uncharacterized membrane protein